MRARLAIAVSGQVCELREVVLRAKPPALLDASPKATVPVLVTTDGTVIDQSLDIMLWALRQNDPAGWLAPEEGGLVAMLDLIAECDGSFKSQLDRYKYPQRFELPGGEPYREQAGTWLAKLDARLAARTFLFGGRAALADMAIAPFIRQFAHTDIDWFQGQPWPHLQAWLASWTQSDLFELAMGKYPVWSEGSSAVLFPPDA